MFHTINYNLKDSSTTDITSFNGKFPKKVFYPLKDVFFQEKVSNKIILFLNLYTNILHLFIILDFIENLQEKRKLENKVNLIIK